MFDKCFNFFLFSLIYRYPRNRTAPPKEYPSSVKRREERKQKNYVKLRAEHQLRPPCKACRRNCTSKFTELHRQRLNDEFWALDFSGRRQFAKNHISCGPIDRRTGRTERRLYSFNYFLKNEKYELIKVCRMFFLTTLGYAKNNSTLITSTSFDIEEEDIDGRGRYSRKNVTQTNDTTATTNDESVLVGDGESIKLEPWDTAKDRPKYLKGGEVKWKIREKHRIQLVEQEEERLRIIKSRHPQVRRCVATCTAKCIRRFSKARCFEIHDRYWRMTSKEKGEFRRSNVFLRKIPDRARKYDPIRKKTVRNVCSFTKTEENPEDRVYVCQWFFLSTLGYQTSMTSIINKTPGLTFLPADTNLEQTDDGLLSETEIGEDENDKQMVQFYKEKAQQKAAKKSSYKKRYSDDESEAMSTSSDSDDEDDDSMEVDQSIKSDEGGDDFTHDYDDDNSMKHESMDEEYLEDLEPAEEMIVKVEPTIETVKIEIEAAILDDEDEEEEEMEELVKEQPKDKSHFETVSIVEPTYVVKAELGKALTPSKPLLNETAAFNPLAGRSTRTKYLVESEPIKTIRPPCSVKCRRHCRQQFTESRRVRIHDEYWSADVRGRFDFINKFTTQTTPKQRTTVEVFKERQFSVNYYMKTADERVVKVCREFFLATLGYKKTSSAVLDNVLKESRRRRFENSFEGGADLQLLADRVCEHIELFKPVTLEEGSSKRYFTSDIDCRLLFDTYMTANPNLKCSHEEFRKILLQSGHSFSQRDTGEGCEQCLCHSLHTKKCSSDQCEECAQHKRHRQRIDDCQRFYDTDARKTNDDRRIIAQVHFGVHQLPRIDFKKELLCASRLTAACLTFSHLSSTQHRPFVAAWNETVSGFEADDIMSAFYTFFVHNRDAREIILWVDSGFSQTKSWSFFNFIVRMLKCEEISAKTIIIKYFEVGHSIESSNHMSAQIEEVIGHRKTIYDFADLTAVAQQAKGGQAVVKTMYPQDFRNWIDDINADAFQGAKFPALSEIAVLKIYKTKYEMYQYYSKDYNLASLCELINVNGKFTDNSLKYESFERPEMSDELRESIQTTILPLIPITNRQLFWKNLP